MGGNVQGFGDRRFFGLDESNGQLRGGEHLLRALLQARGEDMLRSLGGLQDQSQLRQLSDSFAKTGNLSPTALASLLRSGGIAPGLTVPRPNMSRSSPSRYASAQSFDFGAESSRIGRFLRDHPFERQQIEMALGGRILPSDDGSGTMRIQPFTGGAFPGGGRENVAAFNAQAMLSDLARASGNGGIDPMSAGAFQGMLLGALQQMITQQQGRGGSDPQGFSSLRERGGSPFVDWNQDSPNMARQRAMRGGGSSGGAVQGFSGGAERGGDFGDYSGGGESESRCGGGGCGGGDEIGDMLSSGGLTVEDKITLMIMMIMKKMDKDIEAQANRINALQQQQQSGGAGGAGGGGGAPSIDVETMKLKRLIDKRSQMFDMLRQIIDKYNQTAKGIIDSMGR